MRELTFTGFLGRYVRALSSEPSGNLSKLSEEAAHENPRLREPLLLYALFLDKGPTLLRAAKDPSLRSSYADVLSQFDKASMEAALKSENAGLPESYLKVWRSYQSQKNRPSADAHTKDLMRKRVISLKHSKGVSNYRVYVDLKLNPGNFNAWIKRGESSKISLAAARKTLEYLERKVPAQDGEHAKNR